MLSKPATGSLGTVTEKLVMSQALQEVLCGQKSVNKEEWSRRWGQRRKQRAENIGFVKSPHQTDFRSIFLLV